MRPALLAALASLAVGCGSSTGGAVGVSGQVTFKGRPLDRGTVQLMFLGPPGGAAAGAAVQNGRYAIPADHGLAPGTYKVVITCPSDAGGGDAEAVMNGKKVAGPATELIPPEFNRASDKTVDVTAAGPNRFDFTIP